MKIRLSKNSIYKLFLIAIIFDAYCFFSIGARGITLFYVVSALFIPIGLVNLSEIVMSIKRNPYALIMIVYMVVNHFITKSNDLNALFLSIFLWIFYLLSYRRVGKEYFEKSVELYQMIMNIFAIYGIYQVIGFYFEWSFVDPSLDDFMVAGYNWGNWISIASIRLRRANAIFREPSFFSQFLAISLLIYEKRIFDGAIDCGHTHKYRMYYIWFAINLLAMILTFAGSGYIMFIVGTGYLIISSKASVIMAFVRRHSLLIFVGIVILLIFFIVPNPLLSYMWGRTAEFDSTNAKSISAYLRFVKPYKAMIEIISRSPIWGLGMGNAYGYITASVGNLGNSMQSALPRSFVELGLVGGILYILFMIKAWNKGNCESGSYKAMLCGVYLMTLMHGTWSSEVYWLLLGFLNVDIIAIPNTELSSNLQMAL